MSERYGICRHCLGHGSLKETECGRCSGTGFSGDATDYLDGRYALKLDRGNQREAYDKAIAVFLSVLDSAKPKGFGP